MFEWNDINKPATLTWKHTITSDLTRGENDSYHPGVVFPLQLIGAGADKLQRTLPSQLIQEWMLIVRFTIEDESQMWVCVGGFFNFFSDLTLWSALYNLSVPSKAVMNWDR